MFIKVKKIIIILILNFVLFNCGVYKFSDVSIPPEVKTIKINPFLNTSLLVNNTINSLATTELINKVQNQTKLYIITKGKADYEITGTITNYASNFISIANNQASENQLTLSINFAFVNNIEDIVTNVKSREVSFTASENYSATKSLNSVENDILSRLIPQITNQAFNQFFSSW